MRSRLLTVRTSYLPEMIWLTRPWALPVAAPIRVWLIPATAFSSRNSSPMSRRANAAVTSGRDQKSGEIAGGPNALSRIWAPCLAGACALGGMDSQTTWYIGSITLRGMGLGAVLFQVGQHGETFTGESV